VGTDRPFETGLAIAWVETLLLSQNRLRRNSFDHYPESRLMRNPAANNCEQDGPAILKFDPNHVRNRKKVDEGVIPTAEQTLGQFIPLIYHYNMLQDEDRVGAFRAAIELIVKPGMRVAELGSGTGILSSLAARCGATVDAVERNPELVECSRRFLADNGLDHQVGVTQCDASAWIPPQPIDVVICEMLHVGLLREKQAQVIAAFKRNYVARFGTRLPIFIPEVSILMCQPVQQSFDFAGYVAPIPLFQAPLLVQPRTIEIAPLVPYETVTYDQLIPTSMELSPSFVAERDGLVNAIRLVTQNVLGIDMQAQRAITWANQCLVMPLQSPVRCVAGDMIELTLRYQTGESIESVVYDARLQRKSFYRNAA